jgi:hypothetical protein
MTTFRWIIGSLFLLFGAGAVLSFVLFIVVDVDVWIKRARAFRRLASATALLWFNIEIWRRVVTVIVNWK